MGRRYSRISRRSRRARAERNHSKYIYLLLKQRNAKMGVSKRGMAILNSFVEDTLKRITDEAKVIMKFTQRSTFDARTVQTAVKLVIPGELREHAVEESNKAVSKYQASLK